MNRPKTFALDPPYEITRDVINDINNNDRVILINFNTNGKENQWINTQTGLQHGFDKVYAYDMSKLDSDFINQNKVIISNKKGKGLWLWKPYIILKTLNECKSENDIVVYADSNTYFRRNIGELLLYMQQPKYHDMIIFDTRPSNKEYKRTKRDVFIALDHDTPACSTSIQRTSSYIIFRNTTKSKDFVREWLTKCQDEQLISDSPNIHNKPNYLRFKGHHYDQSIFSVLSKKHEIVSLPLRTARNFIVKRTVNKLHY